MVRSGYSSDQNAAASRMTTARNALITCGVALVAIAVVLGANLGGNIPESAWVVLGGLTFLGTTFLVLGLLILRSPVPCAYAALVLSIGVGVAVIVAKPETFCYAGLALIGLMGGEMKLIRAAREYDRMVNPESFVRKGGIQTPKGRVKTPPADPSRPWNR